MHDERGAVVDRVLQHLHQLGAVRQLDHLAALAVVVLGDHRDGELDVLVHEGIHGRPDERGVEIRRDVLQPHQGTVPLGGVRREEFEQQIVEDQVTVGAGDVGQWILGQIDQRTTARGPGPRRGLRAGGRGEHLGLGAERLGRQPGVDLQGPAERLALVLDLVVDALVGPGARHDGQAAVQLPEVLPDPHHGGCTGRDIVQEGVGERLVVGGPDVDPGLGTGEITRDIVDHRFGPP